jgi:isoleucyl-tRNA synthetase
VRAIQDMRKEAGYEVVDRIFVSLKGDLAVRVIELYAPMIAEDTLADSVSHELDGGVDIDREIEVEGGGIRVGVKRV